jgi:hypothetical protein
MKILKRHRGDFIHQAAKLLSSRIEPFLQGESESRPFSLNIEQLDDPDSLTSEAHDSPAFLELCHPA